MFLPEPGYCARALAAPPNKTRAAGNLRLALWANVRIAFTICIAFTKTPSS